MSCKHVLNIDLSKTFSENYEPIRILAWLLYKFIGNNCHLRLSSKFIQTQKRFSNSLDKTSILTWKLIVALRILSGKKHPKIKLQHLRKIWIWTFGFLVPQINSVSEVLKLEQIFQKNKVVTGKTPLFVIGPFCSRHSIYLNISFWQSSFEWKWCVFNLSGFS